MSKGKETRMDKKAAKMGCEKPRFLVFRKKKPKNSRSLNFRFLGFLEKPFKVQILDSQ